MLSPRSSATDTSGYVPFTRASACPAAWSAVLSAGIGSLFRVCGAAQRSGSGAHGGVRCGVRARCGPDAVVVDDLVAQSPRCLGGQKRAIVMALGMTRLSLTGMVSDLVCLVPVKAQVVERTRDLRARSTAMGSLSFAYSRPAGSPCNRGTPRVSAP